MDRFAKLVIVVCLGVCAAAHAGYAQLAAPPGFGSVGGGFGYATAANDAVAGRIVTSSLTSNVGGQAVRMGVAYRFAANAPIYAARAIFLNPWLAAGVGIAAWLASSGLTYDSQTKQWTRPDPNAFGAVVYWTGVGSMPSVVYASASSACSAWSAGYSAPTYRNVSLTSVTEGECRNAYQQDSFGRWVDGTGRIDVRKQVNPCGASGNPAAGCSAAQRQPVTQQQMVDLLNPANQVGWPMPDSVPKELPPGTLLPVEQPVINPSPGQNPASQPLFVPTGNPVRNPNYDPSAPASPANQPYFQPGVRVVPTPTPSSPWQVDLQPVDRPVSSPTPNPNPQVDPSSDPNQSDKPKEDAPDLCQLHPEILACQKLDEPADTDLPSSEKPVTITPDSGWGADNAACPAPRHLTVQGRDIPIPFDLFCQYMQGMRPIIIAMAWLSAAFILLGARESNG